MLTVCSYSRLGKQKPAWVGLKPDNTLVNLYLSDRGLNMKYEAIDQAEINYLSKQHEWLVEPLLRASGIVQTMPFFKWVRHLEPPRDFKPAATQLFYHSATFPKAIGLMLALTPMSENHMMSFYANHACGEAAHHKLLMEWMLSYDILQHCEEIGLVMPTVETNACVNLAYQLATETDRAKWLVAINCGIERCSNDFFKVVAPKMHEIGAGHVYFDLHAEADEHHSIMGLKYIKTEDPESPRGRMLIAKALESVSLWAAMLHSWIGLDVFPHFDLDGQLKSSPNSYNRQVALIEL